MYSISRTMEHHADGINGSDDFAHQTARCSKQEVDAQTADVKPRYAGKPSYISYRQDTAPAAKFPADDGLSLCTTNTSRARCGSAARFPRTRSGARRTLRSRADRSLPSSRWRAPHTSRRRLPTKRQQHHRASILHFKHPGHPPFCNVSYKPSVR